MFKEIKFNTMVMSIVYIILGLILLIFPDTTARTICYVAGGAIIALGVITIFSYMAREIRIRYYQIIELLLRRISQTIIKSIIFGNFAQKLVMIGIMPIIKPY